MALWSNRKLILIYNLIATGFKLFVLKHRRSQIIVEGDENHNETKKLETLCINFLEKNTTSTNSNSENTQRVTVKYRMHQKKYTMMFITGRTLRKMVSQSSKIFKEIGTPQRVEEENIWKKISQEDGSAVDICSTEKVFNSGVAETELPSSTGN